MEVTKMKEYNGKQYTKFYKTHDINGNPIIKVFYTNGTTEII